MVQTLVTRRTVNRIELVWVSDASGNASINTNILSGTLERVSFVPDTGGTKPDDLYDVVLNDGDGIDVLSEQGMQLSDTPASHLLLSAAIDGALNLVVAGAGDSNGGKVVLYVRWQ